MKLHGFLLLSLLAIAGCASRSQGVAAHATGPRAAEDLSFSEPAEANLYLGIVDGIIKQGRYEAAIAFLDRYQKSEATTPRYQLLRGEALLGAKRYEDATAAFTAASKSNLAPQAWCGLGRIEAARGNWDAASVDFSRASNLDPANARYLNNLGYAKLQLDMSTSKIEAAKTDLERAYELDPGSNTIRNNLILAVHLAGDHDRLTTLLATIQDEKQRKRVMDFIEHGGVSHDHDPSSSGGGIR